MAYRFTDTEKWKDAWFSKLPQLQKLLFIYLCDNCDIAGFIDVNYRQWAFDMGSQEQTIEGALEGLQRGLVISNCKEAIYIRNFLKHQKNYPLNEKNAAHRGIIKCFQTKGYKFDIQDINDFIEGASKGLTSPSGNSNGKGNGIGKEEKPEKDLNNWCNNFEVYRQDLRNAYLEIINDTKWMQERETYHPKADIKLTIDKAIKDFWSTEQGWKHKKKKPKEGICWRSTFNNILSHKTNIVWKTQ